MNGPGIEPTGKEVRRHMCLYIIFRDRVVLE
jgi:hypothetical protein